jgi:hypothetical protein
MNRRSFVQAVTAAPLFARHLISAPPSSKVRLASFGAAGMAFITADGIARHPKVELVCAADVDSSRLDQFKAKYPSARIYQDWREMLKKERKQLDAACVGTPDHMHAPMAMSAMRAGLHVYVQKPLTHDIFEARKLQETARKKKLVSQMGIQQHSTREYQTAVAVIQAGAIGKVKEVHTWSNKKWGDTDPMPDRSDTPPPTLNWDLWLGVAASRPFIGDAYYHPENWRKRIDFGTATFGDMGCHIFDPVFAALELTAPLTVLSEGPPPTQHNWALNSIIHYQFPGTRYTEGKTVPISWYDGEERPPRAIQDLLGNRRLPAQGSIFVGAKGVMLLGHTNMPVLLPEDNYRSYPIPVMEPKNHYFQFADAILGNGKATTAFDYSGPLSESILLGPLATRFPKLTLEWDAEKLKFRNSEEATRFVRRSYREKWHVKGLS